MKKILIIAVMTSFYLSACKKNTVLPPAQPAAGLYIVNAVTGSSPLIIKNASTNFVFSKVPSSQQVTYGTRKTFGPVPGSYNYQFIQTTDTLHTLISTNQTFQAGQLYSLFLTGTTAQPDQFIVNDAVLKHAASDSTGSVRFVNLSVGSNPISVDIAGQPNGSETQNLAYKSITVFKNYAATYKVSSYKFEFRDQATGTLIASYTFTGVNNGSGTNTTTNTFRYMNQTLALIGQPGSTSAPQQIVVINNY